MTTPLEALAATAPEPPQTKGNQKFDVQAWLQKYGVKIQRVDSYNGGDRIILEVCVFNGDHKGTSAAVIVGADGKIGYSCQHNGCADKHWGDVRELFEPGYQERKQNYGARNYETKPLNQKEAEAVDYALTDAGNGEAIANKWQHKIRYVFEWKSWIVYSHGRWQTDTTGRVRAIAVETMRQLYRDTSKIEDTDEKKRRANWYIGSESDNRINSALNFAISQPGISITADQLDNQPWLLNVKNGTLNLQTCQLRAAQPEDLLTQYIDINYSPDATAKEWLEFINTILGNRADLIDYVQRGIGYTLNGTQLERVFFFLYGLGMNGKSQLMTALRIVLGPYALEAKPEIFMEKRFSGSGPDEGQAALQGIRLLTATEVKKGQYLDTSLVKRMTGGEPIWHERKFQRGYSFYPTHTLWLSGNHEPGIKDSTDSIWDRLNKIPFEVRIDVKNEIKGYGEKLAKNYAEAILAWCVAGAIAWNERGLSGAPDCVVLANSEYRASQDVLHNFLENIERTPGENITVAELHKAYVMFCAADDTEPLGKKNFNDALRERGFKDKRGTGNKPTWQNMKLNSYLVTLVTQKKESFLTTPAREETFPNLGNESNSVREKLLFDVLGMSLDAAIYLWRKHGAPIVRLDQCRTCLDLEKFLQHEDISAEHLAAIAVWLKEHSERANQ